MSYITRLVFFFTVTATTEIYTLSLHDALPIWQWSSRSGHAGARHFLGMEIGVRRLQRHAAARADRQCRIEPGIKLELARDRKSTRLNSSHGYISYAVFCLKKKKEQQDTKSGTP